MKYMGSKRAMLGNGLGELLAAEVPKSRRFVDLFTGSGAVAIHVASRFDLPVFAFDLQTYSTVLANAVIGRRAVFEWQRSLSNWHGRAMAVVKSLHAPEAVIVSKKTVAACRVWCAAQTELPITKAYGGHYFSPQQAIWIDALRKKLPRREPARTIALASIIQGASQCAAAPGHTAQPFQPTQTAKRFLEEAWNKDIILRINTAFASIAAQYAYQVGRSDVVDANTAATTLKEGDLVFIDPPYSGVHYSRFYHVLETIARGSCGEVTGVGRYPARERRPRSSYSISTESVTALSGLLEAVSSRGARAILTFPDHVCSNGLSGDSVRKIASMHFRLREKIVASKFSTLGGTGNLKLNDEGGRSARQHANELILVLTPK